MMNILYFECQMGAAGDMITASLLSLFDNPDEILNSLNQLGIPGIKYHLERTDDHDISGLRVHVTVNGIEEITNDISHHDCGEHHHTDHEHPHADHEHHHGEHEHHHTTLSDIQSIVDNLQIDSRVRTDIMSVYTLIANAESAVHGVNVEEIHFHEVGSMDAVADISAVCYMIHRLQPDAIVCSPIHVGSGHVHCAHGVLPVPAPATAWLLKGIPSYGGHISGELCTPTGAALLRHFASSYAPMPMMCVSKIGYGMGHKSFSCPNIIRVFWGQSADESDIIVELNCNIDDMTPESLGFAQEQLFKVGALEVFTTAVTMKKSRCGFVLTVHAPVALRDVMLKTIFKHTTTIGVRATICQRYTLQRQIEAFQTPYGDVRIKRSSGYGVVKEKYEYEDLARIAQEQGISLHELKNLLDVPHHLQAGKT